METIKYWWKVIIWHPLDIADKILVLVGGVSGYLHKGSDPVTVNLAWQIPLGAILLLLIWRLMQIPVKLKDDIRRERVGLPPLTLESVSQRIVDIESNVRKLKEKVDPTSVDLDNIRQKVFWDFKTFNYSMIGGITRAVVFVFEVTNASSTWLGTTGNVKGDLIVLAWRLLGATWKVDCDGIEPDKKGEVRIIFPVAETFARTLAFKPQEGYFYANFSEMSIEFKTKDNGLEQILGYMPIPVSQIDIPIKDHPSFMKLRKIVEWEDSLGEDKRITK